MVSISHGFANYLNLRPNVNLISDYLGSHIPYLPVGHGTMRLQKLHSTSIYMPTPGLPIPFLERLKDHFDPDLMERIVAGLSGSRGTGFRVNRLIAGPGRGIDDLVSSGMAFRVFDPIPDAGWVSAVDRDALLASEAYGRKDIYVQNLASMIPVHVLEPESGERILDLAAAPGSKTLQIAARVGPIGEIAAVDVVKKRFFRLKANLEENGGTFVRTFLQDGARVWRYRPEYFDRVLLDAPCASEGRFRMGIPDSFSYWSREKVSEMVRKQKKLLYSAVQCLRPGGTLVYSTCSLSVRENEAMIERILRRFDGKLEILPLDPVYAECIPPRLTDGKKSFREAISGALRIVPSERMEGFFVCKMRKMATTVE